MPGNIYPMPVLLSKLVTRPGPRTTKIHLLIFVLTFFSFLVPVEAHDWYIGIRNPNSGVGCCGARDCESIKDLARIVETKDEFILDGKWHFKKSEALPAQEWKPGETGYHACIWGGKPRCFFYPTNA